MSMTILFFLECARGTLLICLVTKNAQSVLIPNNVEDISEKFFSACIDLSYVIFGAPSVLKLTWEECQFDPDVRNIHIPESVEDICEGCCGRCGGLSRVTFGEPSSLKRIGKKALSGSSLCEIHIPDSVEELAR